MKKLIVFALVLAMAFAVPTAVLADAFISSPSNQDAPTLESATPTPEDWDGEITVGGYGDRGNLPEDEKKDMESAYEDIKDAKDVTDLTDELEDVLKDAGLTPEDVAVGSLFDINPSKDGIESAQIELSDELFEDFVALLYYDGKEWHVVDATRNGKKISFETPGFGTYAVVVATDNAPDSPGTGEALPVGFIALAAVFGVCGVCFLVKSKVNA